jgi:hypothetical protein
MVKRLRVDVADYAHRENERMIPRLNGMIYEKDSAEIAELIATGDVNHDKVKSFDLMLQRSVFFFEIFDFG